MKTFTTYNKELSLVESLAKYFTFAKKETTEDGIKFIGVHMNEDVKYDTSILEKDSNIYALEFHSNGWMDVYESDNTLSYTIINNNPMVPYVFTDADNFIIDNPSDFDVSPTVNLVQTVCQSKISEVAEILRKMTPEEAKLYMQSSGVSLEEKTLTFMLVLIKNGPEYWANFQPYCTPTW